MNARIAALLDQGQSVWQDDIARSMICSGSLKSMIDDVGIRGVTSNPTIFEKAISSSSDYDSQISELAAKGKSPAEIFEELAVEDVRDACDLFRPIYDVSDGADGFVSIEVAPDLARDTAGTREQVKRLWAKVDRPNVMIKIPGTIEGAPVVEEMLTEGRNINITLLFSIEAYDRVARAYLSAIENRAAAGKPIDRLASVASFFVSRVDTAVDALLDGQIASATDAAKKTRLEGLKGKAAIANAKLAYERFKDLFGTAQFERLRELGARPQRPLWASTGTKNAAYSDVLYIDNLIGPHTVNTMPGKTIQAFLDHGDVRRTVDEGIGDAERVMEDLAAVGIDFDAVTAKLENDGIVAFEKSFDTLLAGVEGKRATLAAAD